MIQKNTLYLLFLFLFIGCDEIDSIPKLDHIGGNFSLNSSLGKKVALSDFKGQPVLLFFGYTNCPDVCPLTMGRVNSLLKNADYEDKVQVLFIGIDVKKDTPDRLREYLAFFNPNFIGLSGDQTEIDTVLQLFKAVGYEENDSLFTHTSRIYLIDGDGILRYMYSEEQEEKLKKDLGILLSV